jgi:probable HAF family extracellular repeat protein
MKRKFLALACASILSSAALAQDTYKVSDLGRVVPLGMNSVGQVVGRDLNNGHPFIWTPSTAHGTSGTFTYPAELASYFGYATAINDLGQMVGWYDYSETEIRSFLWTPTSANATTGTTVFPMGDLNAGATAINALGQISTGGIQGAWVWTPDIANGSTGSDQYVGEGTATGINYYGQLALTLDIFGISLGAYLVTPDSPNGAYSSFTQLQPVAGGVIDVFAINTSGCLTGSTSTAITSNGHTLTHAYRWTPTTPNSNDGTIVDIDPVATRNSFGYSIDDSGRVCGALTLDDTRNTYHAFISKGSTLIDLNKYVGANSGIVLSKSHQSNSANEIICEGYLNGSWHGFLLTPSTVTQDTITLEQQVMHLVQLGALLPANGQSLYAKLNSALTKLNAGDKSGAISDLKAFINQVKTFIKTGKLTTVDGQGLIDAANLVIAALGG